MKNANVSKTTYIRLSDGRVGYVNSIKNKKFINDLARLQLTYKTISQNEYELEMLKNTLSPEQFYKNVLGGKKVFENE